MTIKKGPLTSNPAGSPRVLGLKPPSGYGRQQFLRDVNRVSQPTDRRDGAKK